MIGVCKVLKNILGFALIVPKIVVHVSILKFEEMAKLSHSIEVNCYYGKVYFWNYKDVTAVSC